MKEMKVVCFIRPAMPEWVPADDPGDAGLITNLWSWRMVVLPTNGPCLYEARRADLYVSGSAPDVETAKREVFDKVVQIEADSYYSTCAARAYDHHLAMGGSEPY